MLKISLIDFFIKQNITDKTGEFYFLLPSEQLSLSPAQLLLSNAPLKNRALMVQLFLSGSHMQNSHIVTARRSVHK